MDLTNYWLSRQSEHSYFEDALSDQAIDWVMKQNQSCLDCIGEPSCTPLYDKVLSILDSKEKIPHVCKIGTLFYNFWQDADSKRGIWRRTTFESYSTSNVEWETVLDLDKLCEKENESWVWKGQVIYYPLDHTLEPELVLLCLSRGGSDAQVIREFNIKTKEFVLLPSEGGKGFYLPEAKSQVSWIDHNTLLIGTDDWSEIVTHEDGSPMIDAKTGIPQRSGWSLTDSGYPRINRLWRRSEQLSNGDNQSSNVIDPQIPVELQRLQAESVILFEAEKKDVWLHSYLVSGHLR
jgi:prolyl oligopeptidase